LAFGRFGARIARIHGEIREKDETAPQSPKRGMVGFQRSQQQIEVVSLGYRLSQFFQQPLEVFLRTLLAMKADAVMNLEVALAGVSCEDVILLGLLDPLPRRLFHREPCPWR